MFDIDIYCQKNIPSESKTDNPVNSHYEKKKGKHWERNGDVSSLLLLSIFLLQTEEGFTLGDQV